MKVEELMIGDWVEIEGEYTDITSINRTEINTGCMKEVDIRYVNLIPITPKILEKNGFEDYSDKEWEFTSFGIKGTNNEFDSIFIEKVFYDDNHKWCVDISVYGEIYAKIFINNVHELQHALRLCKIDKEIEL